MSFYRLEKEKPIEKVGQSYKEATTKHTSLVCFAPYDLFLSEISISKASRGSDVGGTTVLASVTCFWGDV